jgi:hypothetical protein
VSYLEVLSLHWQWGTEKNDRNLRIGDALGSVKPFMSPMCYTCFVNSYIRCWYSNHITGLYVCACSYIDHIDSHLCPHVLVLSLINSCFLWICIYMNYFWSSLCFLSVCVITIPINVNLKLFAVVKVFGLWSFESWHCSIQDGYHHFRRTCWLKMEGSDSSEMLVTISNVAHHQDPKHHI